MLERTKSNRIPRRRPSNLNLKLPSTGRLETLDDNRCSDDSSQSSAAAPVFASVHRPRHAGISAIKRDGIQQQLPPPLPSQNYHHHHHHHHRPSYHQYQQQRRQQQQLQLQFQQQQQQQQYQHQSATTANASLTIDSTAAETNLAVGFHQDNDGNSASKLVVNNNKARMWYDGSNNGAVAMHHHHHQPQGTFTGSTYSNGKQSTAVPISSQPTTRQTLGPGMQQQHHQHQQYMAPTNATSSNWPQNQINSNANLPQTDLARNPPPAPAAGSRIPTVQQQNFNQISKTATNLLNDIYEKHLLSQTTFDNVGATALGPGMIILGGGGGGGGAASGGYKSVNHQHQHSSSSYPVQYDQQPAPVHQRQQQQPNAKPPPQKAIHFLKNPNPQPTLAPPPTTQSKAQMAPQLPSAPHLHFHFAGGFVEPTCNKVQQLPGIMEITPSVTLPLPHPPDPPPPTLLNHVYETIAERPPLPLPERSSGVAQQQQEQLTTNSSNINKNNPTLPCNNQQPNRALRKRQPNAGGISSGSGRNSKVNVGNKRSTSMAGSSGDVAINKRECCDTTTAPQQSSSTNSSSANPVMVANQRKQHMSATDDDNYFHPSSDVGGHQRQPIPEDYYHRNHHQHQQQQQSQNYYHHPPAPAQQPSNKLVVPPYFPPPPTHHHQSQSHHSESHITQQQQQQQQQRPPQQQQYNNQQRTRADGENNHLKMAAAFQLLREHQSHHGPTMHQQKVQQHPRQQQQPHAAPASPFSTENEINSFACVAATTSTSSNIREVPLGSVANNGGGVLHASFIEQAALLPHKTCGAGGTLPVVFEEETTIDMDVDLDGAAALPGPGGVTIADEDGGVGVAKYPYRNSKIEVMLETAQAMAAAAYYARAAQKLAQGCSSKSRSADMSNTSSRNGGFCGALQRAPPPMPPGLARRLANKENYGIGKVKVMLRVSDSHADEENPHFMTVDKKKRQVTLTDPSAASQVAASTSQERGPMVAAPKMFAFDSLFTADDQQSDVCSSALSEVIPAVLEGSDGCLLTIGYPTSGQSRTMLGGINSSTELGAIPCAISWLYKGINERRQKSGARFSVRVSALGVSATKPDSSSKDLLAAHATESDDSPGVYLRDDFLGGPTELRAPTAERAALFLDAALAGRPHGGLEPAMIFTLHVYQYSLSRKGGVAGGRSRLHLIDLGGCANRSGGLPLSGIGNILLAILSGQRHPPNKDHPLTPLLKDCLAPLTCHVAIMAHVSHTQSHSDALTTIQLASRIHRMRRRKHRFPILSAAAAAAADKAGGGGLGGINGGHQSTGSSAGSGPDPSSSDLSADTVIYMGPSDDATDGEHPPVYLPSLSSGDNRCVMSKALKGSGVEKQQLQSQSKIGASVAVLSAKKIAQKAPQSPAISSRTGSIKRSQVVTGANSPTPVEQQPPQQFFSPVHSLKAIPHSASSPKIVAGSLRHQGIMSCSKGSNVPSPKGSPLRRPGIGVGGIAAESLNAAAAGQTSDVSGSPMRKIIEEQWIDGPRVSRAKVAEARHLMREVNHVKQCETWIDGPKSQSAKSLTAGNLPANSSQTPGYGFMDSHKKTMIRQWVENQSSQVFQSTSAASSPTHSNQQQQLAQQAQHLRNLTYHLSQYKHKSLDDEQYHGSSQQLHQLDQQSLRSSQLEMVNPIGAGLTNAMSTTNASAPAEIRMRCGIKSQHTATAGSRDGTDLHSERSHTGYGMICTSGGVDHHSGSGVGQDCDEDDDSGPSEVPPALPLIDPLGSRELSHESLHRIISRHVSRESLYQSQSQMQQQQPPPHHYSQHSMGMSDCGLQVTEEEIARTMGCEHPLAALSHCDMSVVSSFNVGDAFSDCAMGERTRNQFDQLARLREIFTSQLAMAEVTPVFRMGCDVGSVYSEPAYRFNTGPGSVCSEPPYRPPSPRQSLHASRSPSQGSLPSLNGIMQIAGMEQYASLRHPDGASDPNLPKIEKPFIAEHQDDAGGEIDEKSALLGSAKRPSAEHHPSPIIHSHISAMMPSSTQNQLPLLPLNTSSEAYDSGHDSSTPRTSKHSGISRRAESGYHSVATARDSDESSFTSGLSKEHHNRITVKKKQKDKSLCNWLMNPFTCTYPETEGEISDF